LFSGVPNHYCIKDSDVKQFKKIISNHIYADYADMMNRRVNMVLVRDHFKQTVIEAFTEHRYKYGVDDDKIREYITTIRTIE
jgi:hypothetical protein